MPAAVVGGVIAGAGAIGGAALSSKAQKKAAKTAANAQLDATAQNNALAREQYGLNQAALAPWQQRGNAAGTAVNALLGIGQMAPANNNGPAPTPATASALGFYGNGAATNAMGGGYIAPGSNLREGQGYYNGEPVNALMYGASNGYPAENAFAPMAATTTAAPAGNPNQQYQDAFANYQNSTGYQFRLGEGMRALDNSAASRGVLNSGAAAKAALKYGQNIASGEFGNYLAQLTGVSQQGLSAANAQAGVGTSLVNAVSNNNNAAAGALGNQAFVNGNAQSQMWGTVGNTLGNLGATFASSFGGGGGVNALSNGAFGLKSGFKN
jgi:hypothetical protein